MTTYAIKQFHNNPSKKNIVTTRKKINHLKIIYISRQIQTCRCLCNATTKDYIEWVSTTYVLTYV